MDYRVPVMTKGLDVLVSAGRTDVIVFGWMFALEWG
jgi:hypothetical protein